MDQRKLGYDSNVRVSTGDASMCSQRRASSSTQKSVVHPTPDLLVHARISQKLHAFHCFFPLYSWSIHLGCYNKIPHPGWLINKRTLLHTVLEAGSLRSGCQHGWVLVTARSGLQTSCCGRRDWGFFGSLFHKALTS